MSNEIDEAFTYHQLGDIDLRAHQEQDPELQEISQWITDH